MKSSRGFTFIELAVTLAIMSVLAALILPSARDMLNNGRTTASIEQAEALLAVCDVARTKSIGTVISKDRYIVDVCTTRLLTGPPLTSWPCLSLMVSRFQP